MKQKPKMARLVYRNPHFNVGTYSTHSEMAMSLDDEHKPYVRSKRNFSNLPDGYSDTKWIRRCRSWKHRARKRHQWMKHAMHPSEWAFIRNIRNWWENDEMKI